FGIAAIQAGVAPWMAVLVSIMVYAGAGQFVLVTLLASGASAWTIITTVVLMNVRHLFYGPSLLPKLTVHKRRWPLPLLAAGLTDEVFATAMGSAERVPAPQRETWYLGLQLGSYSSWVGGTAIGAILGHQISQQAQWLQITLNFVLPALFFALLLELLAHSRWQVMAVAMLATALLLLVLPAHWAMLGGMAAGGLVSALQAPTPNQIKETQA
ncbi:MAG: AzlC family ABC transporter permease, partial [Brachymonas sp.]|nr:AzlC family ABC transporter permease [Brachymonas sp.]